MQKRKFDELISHFNRKVSDMSIDQKYKMELLGMISAIGFAHEKELGTNLAEVGTDLISRQAAIDALERAKQNIRHNIERAIGRAICEILDEIENGIKQLPSTNCSEFPNNSDTISRQAAIDALKRKQDDGKGDLSRFYNTIIQHDIEAIKQLPPIQPEIVRCKDCKHYRHGLCMKASMCVNKSENGFCDWAERREVTT